MKVIYLFWMLSILMPAIMRFFCILACEIHGGPSDTGTCSCFATIPPLLQAHLSPPWGVQYPWAASPLSHLWCGTWLVMELGSSFYVKISHLFWKLGQFVRRKLYQLPSLCCPYWDFFWMFVSETCQKIW